MRKVITLCLIIFIPYLLQAKENVFNVSTVEGKELHLNGTPEGIITKPYEGKIVFIELWGSWCIPSLLEIPYLVELQKKYQNELRIIAMSLHDMRTKEELKKYISDPKNIDLQKIEEWRSKKNKIKNQKDIKNLQRFINSKKSINYDVVTYADAKEFINYITKRANQEEVCPSIFIFGKDGSFMGSLIGIYDTNKLDKIFQKVVSSSKQ